MRFGPALLVAAWLAGSAHAASPSITGVSPRGISPRGPARLTITGSNLGGVTNLWTYFGARAKCLTNSGSEAVFELANQGNVFPSGVWGIQAQSPDGVSDFALVTIDSFPCTNKSSGIESAAKAQAIAPPAAIDGTFESEEADHYEIEATAGQELAIEVLAHRIGSQADPVLHVLDGAGRELAYCDDEDGAWRDARLRFRAPLDGAYMLAVHDVGYGGGSAFFYRLRVGDFPLVAFRFPLCDPAEQTAVANDEGSGRSSSPANPDGRTWHNNVPALLEREPNETPTQTFSPPAIIDGRFDSPGDRDVYRFSASKDQRVVFQRQSRSLGSPCDVVLRVSKTTGETLATTEPGTGDEALLMHTFKEGGTYHLEARELTGTAPAGAPYRLSVRNDAPEFRLSTEVGKLELAPGASARLKVVCERLGYDGEIRLESPLLLLENNIIPAGKKETEIAAKLPEDAPNFFHLRLTGKGTNGFETLVSTKPALRKNFPLMLVPPNELDGLIAVGRKAK